MPYQDWNAQATWDANYSLYKCDSSGVPLWPIQLVGYTKLTGLPAFLSDQLQKLANREGLAKNANILIVGCGFGWGISKLVSLGFQHVWGVDSSTWIDQNKATESDVASQIVLADITTAAGRATLQQATGVSTWRGIITEDVLTGMSDAEGAALETVLQGLKASNGRVVHLVQIPDNPPASNFTYHTLADWQALYPGDHIYQLGNV